MKQLALVISLLTILNNHCLSTSKTFIREYTYTAGEADSKISSRAIALNQVKRILLEEIGAYLKSEFTLIKEEQSDVYQELTQQQIQSITAGVTETIILGETWNGERYHIKASITVDAEKVTEAIARIEKDDKSQKALEDVTRRAEIASAEIEQLREELAKAQSQNEKLEKQKAYTKASDILTANELFLKGKQAVEKQNYPSAIEEFSKAIKHDPNYSEAYEARGDVFEKIEDYEKALSDYDDAIRLNHPYPWFVYCSRARIVMVLISLAIGRRQRIY